LFEEQIRGEGEQIVVELNARIERFDALLGMDDEADGERILFTVVGARRVVVIFRVEQVQGRSCREASVRKLGPVRIDAVDVRARRRVQVDDREVVLQDTAPDEAPNGHTAVASSDIEGESLNLNRQVPAVVVERT